MLALEVSWTSATQTLPALYSIDAADFHDITSGSSGSFSAGLGYDMVTGLGTPVANKLVPDLALFSPPTGGTVTNPTTTTSVTALKSLSVYDQSVTFAATVDVAVSGVNPPTGTVTFMDGSTALGTATLSRGVAYFSTRRRTWAPTRSPRLTAATRTLRPAPPIHLRRF